MQLSVGAYWELYTEIAGDVGVVVAQWTYCKAMPNKIVT